LLAIFFSIFCFAPVADASVATQNCPKQVRYKFEKGDTLSEVLWAVGSWRLYGPGGRVARIVGASPHKFSSLKNGLIRLNAVVKISVQFCPDPSRWSIENGFLVRIKHTPHGNKKLVPESKPDLVPLPDSVANPVPALIPAPKPIPSKGPATPVNRQSVPAPATPPVIQPVKSSSPSPHVTPLAKFRRIVTPPPILEPVKESLPETKELKGELSPETLSEFVND
jgi:hypothetical protein